MYGSVSLTCVDMPGVIVDVSAAAVVTAVSETEARGGSVTVTAREGAPISVVDVTPCTALTVLLSVCGVNDDASDVTPDETPVAVVSVTVVKADTDDDE